MKSTKGTTSPKSVSVARAVYRAAATAVCVFIAVSAFASSVSAQSIEERRRRVAEHNAASGNNAAARPDTARAKEALFQDKTGATYKKNGEIDKAISAYTKAISLDSTKHLYYRHRGEAFLDGKGDHAAAIRDFSTAIRLGGDAYDYKLRGDAYMAAEDYDAATTDYTEAVRLAPNAAEYKESLAKVKAMRSKIKITFNSPLAATRSNYVVSACVKSESRKVDRVTVTVNGSMQRGIGVVKDDGCDHSVNQAVSLKTGENKIVVEAVLSDGDTKSESIVVTYKPATETVAVNPPADRISPNAVDGRRAALVIGNADYKNSPLKNAANDAKEVAAKLKNLGFEVAIATDVGNKDMKRAIDGFAKTAQGSTIALFFYAGHGVQYNNVNYFLPVDMANINKMSDVEDDATSMDRLMRAMDDTKAAVKIVLLDACRNNPLVRGAGGLASVATKPEGTFIVYATAPGKTAMDNSAFTKSFLRNVDTPGLKIEDLFKKVTLDVRKDTDNFQQPWAESSITGDFYFKR